MKSIRCLSITLTLILTALDADAAGRPEDCGAIESEFDRLGCYDGFFRTEPAIRPSNVESKPQDVLSPVQSRQAEEEQLKGQWFSITPHRPNYLLPASYNGSADFSAYGAFGDLFNDTEMKLQLSLKTQLWPNIWRNSTLWAAYTQQSYWQVYADSTASAPFRETNHEPELIWEVPLEFKLLGFNGRLASLSLIHQSNGRSEPLSRSWNRLAGEVVMENGRFVVSAKSWIRVDDSSNDNNPYIEDFMGRIQLGAAYKGDIHTFALGLKNNLDNENRSGVEFNWTFPLAQHLKGFVQLYSGYGENLIDMENYNNRIGVGIALTDWL